MRILVLNYGSSSLTFKVYDAARGLSCLVSGKARRIGSPGDAASTLEFRHGGEASTERLSLRDHAFAVLRVLAGLEARGVAVDCIGHRWPNGLDRFSTARIDDALLPVLRELVPLIPIHHSIAMAAILECRARWPGLVQYVTTDNAFHRGLPDRASGYFLPRALESRYGFKKIGYHGLSFRYVAERAPALLGRPEKDLRLVVCHLGTGGSEICAVRGGASMDVSMGYTGLPGVPMSTRCGDIDALLPLAVMADCRFGLDEVQDLFNDRSGLLGASGSSSDIRDLLDREARGEEGAALAVELYVRAVKKFIGGFCAALGGADCLVFTDDVGVSVPVLRERALAGLGQFGFVLDPALNKREAGPDGLFVEAPGSRSRILVLPTDEELVMAEEGLALLGGEGA